MRGGHSFLDTILSILNRKVFHKQDKAFDYCLLKGRSPYGN